MRPDRSKRYRFVALFAVLALALAACGDGRGDDDDSAGSDATDENGSDDSGGGGFEIDTSTCPTDPSTVEPGDTIKLGTSLPQSGLYAGFAEILAGEQAYFEYLNEAEGGVEIDGQAYEIELVAEDDAYDAQRTFANVQSLVESDDVFALFNVVGTKNNLAIRDYVQENCVPNVFAGTGSPAWGNHEYPWLIGTTLVPYPLEMQALVSYLEENDPDATIAMLRADDDFGASYSETLKELIAETDHELVAEETYDPETGEVTSQMTSLASSNADVFVLGATLLACPQSLTQLGTTSWKPVTYMSGTCTSKTLMDAAGANGEGVISVAPLMDPNDPQWADNEAMMLYKEQVPKYSPDADITNGIVAYGWSTAALMAETLANAEAPNRLAVMQAARTVDASEIGLQVPGSTWTVNEDDWFLGEDFSLVQYSAADKYFKTIVELEELNGETTEITPENLING